jgi:hypothetical protein
MINERVLFRALFCFAKSKVFDFLKIVNFVTIKNTISSILSLTGRSLDGFNRVINSLNDL